MVGERLKSSDSLKVVKAKAPRAPLSSFIVCDEALSYHLCFHINHVFTVLMTHNRQNTFLFNASIVISRRRHNKKLPAEQDDLQ